MIGISRRQFLFVQIIAAAAAQFVRWCPDDDARDNCVREVHPWILFFIHPVTITTAMNRLWRNFLDTKRTHTHYCDDVRASLSFLAAENWWLVVLVSGVVSSSSSRISLSSVWGGFCTIVLFSSFCCLLSGFVGSAFFLPQLCCSCLVALFCSLSLSVSLSVFCFLVSGKALELGEMGHRHWCNSARGRGVRAWCGVGMAVVCLQRPTVTASSSPSSHRQGYGSLPSFHGACRVLQVNEFNPLNFSRGSVVGWWACRVGIRDSWQEKHLPPLMWGDLELEAQVNWHIVGISLP